MKKRFSLISFAAQVMIGGKSVMSVNTKNSNDYDIELNEQETMFYITSKKTGTVHYVSTANQRWADLIQEETKEVDDNSGASAPLRTRTGKAKA